ncbi:acyltransferase family protein, partial [Yersinia aleksiciae]|uniref:acyltransferase family protein n=1 Tax=Yersinia aleksiciae TaxID=263819 RepID=UPI0021BDD169
MKKNTNQREYFLDAIRAYLMLLGIPFHLSLIYSSHHWAVNSSHPSLVFTLLNDFIHAFRMQVFFVISGYFSFMLYQRYEYVDSHSKPRIAVLRRIKHRVK